MEKWKVLESSYLIKNPFGNLRQDKCLLPNGKLINAYYVNEYPQWVNIVAVTKTGEMVFVKQYRHGGGDFFIEIPGGKGESDQEDPDQAVMRELREETGYVSDQIPLRMTSLHTNPAIATNRIDTYVVLNAYKKFAQQTDDTEEIEVILVPFAKVDGLIRLGEITQIFTVAAYYLAKDYVNRALWELAS